MAVSTPARAKGPRRPLQLQRRIRRVRSQGVLEWDNTASDSSPSNSTNTTTPARAAGGHGGQSASPASIIGALQSLTPQQRLARRTQCKERRQLHTHVRQTRKYADYLQACQESLKSRLTSAEGKAFIRKTALDEKRSIAVVVERLVKSLEAQSVHQYAAYYKKAVALRAAVVRDDVAETASSASSESSESSESESSACDADSFASDDDSAAAAAAAEDDRLMAEHAASGSSLQALAAHAAATTTPAANSATTTTTEVSEAATPELPGAQADADADALAALRPKRRQVTAASPSALVDKGARGSAAVAAAEALRMQAFAMDRLAIDI